MRVTATLALLLLTTCTRDPTSDATPPDSPASTPQAPATAPEPPPRVFTEPVDTPDARKAHEAAAKTLRGPLEPNPLVSFTPIEDPSGRALDPYYSALRDLVAGDDDDDKVRVLVYGASSTAADRWVGYLRGYLQNRFGDGGVGFVAAVPLWRWHRHNEVSVEASRHWKIEHAQKEKTGRLDGHYGLLGASAHTDAERAWARISPAKRALTDVAASTFVELYYLAQPEGGSFDVIAGRKPAGTVTTAASEHAAAYFTPRWSSTPVPLKIQPRGDGEVRLFGAVFERSEPGVVVDTLGIGGTRAANHLDWTASIWADNAKRRDPAMYMLAYGANEAGPDDEDEPIEVYQQALRDVLDRFANTLPDAACVLIGPQDFPQQDENEQWVERPRLSLILESQRTIAAEKGCGFFDTRAMMGGEGSMVKWVEADPPLARGDHLHLTPLGYAHLGRVVADALMAGYDAQP